MYQDSRRICPRDCIEAPILISEKIDGDYSSAKMYNKSKDGMYLEGNLPLKSGSGLYVNMLDMDKPDYYRGYFARVKWCVELDEEYMDDSFFGIGVNYVVKSHNFFGGIGCMTRFNCEVCGNKIPFNELIKTNDFIYKCVKCSDSLEEYPDGNLKSSIENYLLGNIL